MGFVFLVCSERSGSNFIISIVGGHSEVSAPPPTHLFRLFASNESNYGGLDRDENWEVLTEDFVNAFNNQLGLWNTRPTVEHLRQNAKRRDVSALLRLTYEAEAIHDGATRMFVKENHTARFADFLQKNFDPCRFVFMVRDPRDVAASYFSTDGIPGGVARAVEVWSADQEENALLQDSMSESDFFHFLRYEDLIEQPDAELERLTHFFGLDFEPEMLEFHQDKRLRRNAARIEAWSNLTQPVLNTNSGKFASVLTPDEIEYVELCCFDLMAKFGYTPSIVKALPENAKRTERIAELSGYLRPGRYKLASAEEQDTRARRLAMIDTVTSRRLE